ncbi:MAG: hypothetical protein EON56_02180 [Alphaproteobacteria bacterium]|nr:MAG: hypothetical protein EON56_02180 [Alphaproteobacteria bacterium]
MLVAAAVATSAVETWTAGDDGLTQRFAEDLRLATAAMTGPPLRATIAQIEPTSGGKWITTVTFRRAGRDIYVARCTRKERDLPQCAQRAAAAAERLLRKVR